MGRNQPRSGGEDRGIAWTLDALIMLGLMLAGIGYALHVTSTSMTGDTGADLTERQLEQDLVDILSIAHETGALERAVVYWDDSRGSWVDLEPGAAYTLPPDDHPMAVPLSTVLGRRGIGYTIELRFRTDTGEVRSRQLIDQGSPGRHAVEASTTVALDDDIHLENSKNNATLSEAPTFYAPDISPKTRLYTVITVRIVAWQS